MTEEDQYGILTQYYGEMCVQSNLGGSIIGKTADGWLELVTDENRIVSVIDKYNQLMENGSHKLGASKEGGAEVFGKGHSLFSFLEGRILYTKVRAYDITYGILPFPKYDENQAEYGASGYDLYWEIPLTAGEKADMTGTLVSAMSCYNYNIIVPMVWEVILGSKLADAPDDAEMFEMIRDVRDVDIGYAFSTISAVSELVFILDKATPDSVVSYIEKHREKAVSHIEKLNATYAELQG